MLNLPPMEFTFNLNVKGTTTRKVYEGSFTYRRLSIGSQGKADVLRTRLNGDLANVDFQIDKLHEMISWLKFGLIEYPDWWRESSFGENLYDVSIVKEIYDNITDFEKKWTKQVEDASKSTTEASAS